MSKEREDKGKMLNGAMYVLFVLAAGLYGAVIWLFFFV